MTVWRLGRIALITTIIVGLSGCATLSRLNPFGSKTVNATQEASRVNGSETVAVMRGR